MQGRSQDYENTKAKPKAGLQPPKGWGLGRGLCPSQSRNFLIFEK